ncbi:MAG: 50S ribosomal protein L10 [Tenericutes bacterium GWC2_34_14]|nr:MAG: 50S ribosomal protein L10 [Tenericutes bacterium GWA2_35_7]OHE28982.1 MAG: 50S ribosomal protein L10 [Tenericutes bacterium GWC2_34_14]OHE33935.1 MAG: 50S ribosomal protein L10 [Tenericutes bacterium GWE2_34_108]OHE35268.1 MAG: 50S ribosomal protein L10 [Tenericutes bacterium GWF1_35_14]OHE38301.1 MAG: 50S ribosomal protein L10 [Tenericutes bacterium GWF2_35_184]OHE42476.1 MAG: 50S ribosomal protein L10 [Tenericutes bacterium RIFOXYA12_FULL_35_10]OHE42636.1 MAG: 50S ribosomal protein 
MQKAIIERKAESVRELTEKLGRATTVVAFDYPGLTVEAFTKLRNQLREAGCDVTVYKNNISRRASIAAGYDELAHTLVGAKALAISYSDVVAPAKIVFDFAKENKVVTIGSGIVEGKVVGVDAINALATLPSRETLLTMLAVGMLTPLRELAVGLNMISNPQE